MTIFRVGDTVLSTRGQRKGLTGTVVQVLNEAESNGGHYRVDFNEGERSLFKFGNYMTLHKPAPKREFGVFWWRKTMPTGRAASDYSAVQDNSGRVRGYVRLSVVKALDLSEALGKGKPRKGETLMNSHEIRK